LLPLAGKEVEHVLHRLALQSALVISSSCRAEFGLGTAIVVIASPPVEYFLCNEVTFESITLGSGHKFARVRHGRRYGRCVQCGPSGHQVPVVELILVNY
jgi:hypothetical protein